MNRICVVELEYSLTDDNVFVTFRRHDGVRWTFRNYRPGWRSLSRLDDWLKRYKYVPTVELHTIWVTLRYEI